MLKKAMTSSLVCMALCSQSLASGPQQLNLSPQETTQLIEMFRACDATVQACTQANSAKARQIDAQNELLLSQNKTIESERASHDGILNSKPFWFVVGALFTGAMVRLTR